MRIIISLIVFLICLETSLGRGEIRPQPNKKHGSFLHLVVDEIPTFSYENLNAMEYLYTNIKWPLSFDGQGSVIVSFTVKLNGDIDEIIVERGLSPECDNEVIRVLRNMPKWNPGRLNNEPVDVTMYLPITFVIK